MGYDKNRGLIQIAVGYQNKSYTYETIDLSWMQVDQINSTPDQRQDLDSFVNGNGYLKRTVMEHTRTKWEANTTILTYSQKCKFIKLLKRGMGVQDGGKCSSHKRHVHIRYYNEWSDSYESGLFYIPDITFNYKLELNGELVYQPIRFAFIEL